MASVTNSLSISGSQTIAVFGSTGFLGPYIVSALLRRHSHAKVICLNRSLEGEQRTKSALQQTSSSIHDLGRLHFVVADITQPRLGLDVLQYNSFASEVDEVVFNAWNANWGIPLSSFKPLLGAVRHAIELCSASSRNPRLTYISSNCAMMDWPRRHPSQPLLPERPALDTTCATDSGYGKSKSIAEQLLARAHAESGLRVAIVRAGQIAGHSSPATGSAGWPIQGWLYVTFKTAQKLGCWPVHMSALDWIPVDTFAAGIANITGEQTSNETVQVYNMMHPNPAPWDVLYKTLQTRFGLVAELVTLPQWLDKLDPKTFKMHAFMSGAGEGREAESMIFENSNALRVLPKVDIITEDLLEKWLKGWNLSFGEVRAML